MEPLISLLKTGKCSQRATYLLLWLLAFGIDASLGYCLRIAYPFTLCILLLLFLQFSRPLYLLVSFCLTVIAALYFPIGQLYGDPNYNSLVSAIYTHPEEIQGFLTNIPPIYYLGSSCLLLLGLFTARLRLNFPFKNCQIAFMGIFVLASIFYKPLKQALRTGAFEVSQIGFTPVRFIRDLYTVSRAVQEDHKKIKASLGMQDTWKVISATPKYQNYILVIGESERKDLRHNYGFSINNTPFASTSKGVFFDNYLSAGPSTVLSLTHTLATSYQDELQLHNNVIALAKKAGFYTYWISNQHYVGEYDTPISVIGHCADSTSFIRILDPLKFGDTSDEALLPFIQSALTDTTITQPKLIIVHLIGSHYPFDKRTKGQCDVFFHSKKLSHYIQSIRHTDQLLKNITEAAQSTKESWSMLYFSDHGLALEKKLLDHNDKYQESYRVPMFILSSDDTQRESRSAYRSALHFPSLFSQWTEIQESSLITDCCYLSNTFCKNQTSVILFNKTKIEISQLAVNPINP